jgi:hypothetical protein
MYFKKKISIIFFSVQILLFLTSFILLLVYIANLPRKVLRNGELIIFPTSKNMLYAAISLVSIACLLSLIQRYALQKAYTLNGIFSILFFLQVGLIAWIIFYLVQDTSGCPPGEIYYPNINECNEKRSL